MELRTLEYFVAVAEMGTVSSAAVRLHITQPALSRQIRHLEHELEVDLFVRGSGGLTLSAGGRVFLPHAMTVLDAARAARSAATATASGRLAAISIKAPSTTVADVIAPFIATLHPDDPTPTVIESDPTGTRESVDQETDLVVLPHAAPRTAASEPIAVLPIWAHVPDGHPWFGRESVGITELSGETVLALTPGHTPRQILDDAFVRCGVGPAALTECTHPRVAQALAAAGRGVAVLSDDPRFGLHAIAIDTDDGPLQIRLVAAWDAAHHADVALRAFAVRLRDFCRDRYGVAAVPPAGSDLTRPAGAPGTSGS